MACPLNVVKASAVCAGAFLEPRMGWNGADLSSGPDEGFVHSAGRKPIVKGGPCGRFSGRVPCRRGLRHAEAADLTSSASARRELTVCFYVLDVASTGRLGARVCKTARSTPHL